MSAGCVVKFYEYHLVSVLVDDELCTLLPPLVLCMRHKVGPCMSAGEPDSQLLTLLTLLMN